MPASSADDQNTLFHPSLVYTCSSINGAVAFAMFPDVVKILQTEPLCFSGKVEMTIFAKDGHPAP